MKNIEWKISYAPVPYLEAVEFMEKRVSEIIEGKADEMIWLLEHPSIYTAGSSAKEKDLINPEFPVFETGRGGQYTYHGPGQRVVYIMLDLKKRALPGKPDIKKFVYDLEEVIIQTLQEFGIIGMRRPGRVGIWVETKEGEAKIAALGIKVRKWVTFHGIAINISPNLTHFKGIVPCGIREYGVASIESLGLDFALSAFDKVLTDCLQAKFG